MIRINPKTTNTIATLQTGIPYGENDIREKAKKMAQCEQKRGEKITPIAKAFGEFILEKRKELKIQESLMSKDQGGNKGENTKPVYKNDFDKYLLKSKLGIDIGESEGNLEPEVLLREFRKYLEDKGHEEPYVFVDFIRGQITSKGGISKTISLDAIKGEEKEELHNITFSRNDKQNNVVFNANLKFFNGKLSSYGLSSITDYSENRLNATQPVPNFVVHYANKPIWKISLVVRTVNEQYQVAECSSLGEIKIETPMQYYGKMGGVIDQEMGGNIENGLKLYEGFRLEVNKIEKEIEQSK